MFAISVFLTFLSASLCINVIYSLKHLVFYVLLRFSDTLSQLLLNSKLVNELSLKSFTFHVFQRLAINTGLDPCLEFYENVSDIVTYFEVLKTVDQSSDMFLQLII